MYYTPVTLYPANQKINLQDKIITAGSCFADCMGRKFEVHKLNALINPFGTVYNPISLNKQFTAAIENIPPTDSDIVNFQDLCFHYGFHSQFVNKDKEALLNELQQLVQLVHDYLKEAKWLIFTWGSAWVFKKGLSDEIVANCHKQPQRSFRKELLTQDQILDDLNVFIKKLKAFNPDVKIILTISPVRHIRDTLPLNMVSKSLLRVAAHKADIDHDDLYYFPSYEIMMDELRDYRYYKEDMIHPTSQAEDYIWNRFKEVCVDAETTEFIRDWQEIRKAMMHKAFNPLSESHQRFLNKTIERLEKLSSKVDVSKEIDSVKRQII